uniref:Uncharacterized protein n=1 Tax=Anguilla anguilla TaxID=7936 RepID=A0A0E9PQV6_ANGAN
MTQGFGEGRSLLHVGFEKLMGEVLSKEGKHHIASLRIRNEALPQQQFLHNHLSIRKGRPPATPIGVGQFLDTGGRVLV